MKRLALVVLIGCATSPAPAPKPSPAPIIVASAPLPPLPPPEPLPPPTKEEEKALTGVGSAHVESMEFFDAHGVDGGVAVRWWDKFVGAGRDDEIELKMLWGADCHTLTVGPKHEDAAACVTSAPFTLMQDRVTVIVVRNKQPVPVLDVGLTLMDVSVERAVLALALDFAADGMTVSYSELTPNCSRSESTCSRGPAAPAASCVAARAELDTVRSDQVVYPPAHAFVSKACGLLGRYVWKRDQFIREREP